MCEKSAGSVVLVLVLDFSELSEDGDENEDEEDEAAGGFSHRGAR